MTSPTAKPPPEDEPLSGVFNPNDYDWPSHLKRALDELPKKKLQVDIDEMYYVGDHPKVWLTDDIRKKLDDRLNDNMAENYCDVAVDAPVKRLDVTGWVTVGPEPLEDSNEIDIEAIKAVWDDNDLDSVQKDLYTKSRMCGEAFLFVWKDLEKESGYDCNTQDARNVWWPKECHRSKPTRVIQIWADEDEGVWRATCYYKYVCVRLRGPRLKDGGNSEMPQARWFEPDNDDAGGEHGFEYPPVIRFARERKRRGIITQIRSIQDKINKLAANMLVTAEFNAWRKTAILTQQTIDDADLQFRPNRVLVLDPGGGDDGAAPTSIWEGSATELSIFSNEQDKLIDKLFTKACLPGHMKVKSEKVAPSGAAYEADEGPFTEDIGDMQRAYGESWQDWVELIFAGTKLKPQWANQHVKSDFDEAQTVKQYVDAGVPLALALQKYAGWDDEDIKRLEDSPLSPKEQLAMAASQALIDGNGGTNDEAQSNPSGFGGTTAKPPGSGPTSKPSPFTKK